MVTTCCTLSPTKQLCFSCPIPPPRCCNENDRRCLRQQALATRRKGKASPPQHYIKRITEYLNLHPGFHRAVDIATSTDIPKDRIHAALSSMKIKRLAIRTGRHNTTRWKLWTAKPSP